MLESRQIPAVSGSLEHGQVSFQEKKLQLQQPHPAPGVILLCKAEEFWMFLQPAAGTALCRGAVGTHSAVPPCHPRCSSCSDHAGTAQALTESCSGEQPPLTRPKQGRAEGSTAAAPEPEFHPAEPQAHPDSPITPLLKEENNDRLQAVRKYTGFFLFDN